MLIIATIYYFFIAVSLAPLWCAIAVLFGHEVTNSQWGASIVCLILGILAAMLIENRYKEDE